jgi:hypothetical protein
VDNVTILRRSLTVSLIALKIASLMENCNGHKMRVPFFSATSVRRIVRSIKYLASYVQGLLVKLLLFSSVLTKI